MKILAVDYGASRTGLAVCDPTEFLTTPITPQITLKARPKVAAQSCTPSPAGRSRQAPAAVAVHWAVGVRTAP